MAGDPRHDERAHEGLTEFTPLRSPHYETDAEREQAAAELAERGHRAIVRYGRALRDQGVPVERIVPMMHLFLRETFPRKEYEALAATLVSAGIRAFFSTDDLP